MTTARCKSEWMLEMDYSAYIYLYNKVGWDKAEKYYNLCKMFAELQVEPRPPHGQKTEGGST